jgi:ubiquitin-protein ligase
MPGPDLERRAGSRCRDFNQTTCDSQHAFSDAPQEKWSAVYNVRTILLSIQSLLGGACLPPLARVPERACLYPLRKPLYQGLSPPHASR